MSLRTILFDLDGTLVDTAPDLGLALNLQRERHGLPPLAQELIRPHASHGSRGLLGVGFGLVPEHCDFGVMREEYLDLYDQVFTRSPVLFGGVAELLDTLESEGLSWGVVTNKPRRFTVPLMRALGLDERAACVVSGDDAPQAKPHPGTLLMACQIAEAVPAECIYVGDAERDIQAGHAAGMQTVVALYGYLDEHDRPETWGAETMIDAPLDLLAWIGMKGLPVT
jgi:N-acetyl-D-muramate 6-phosphate phosphatase